MFSGIGAFEAALRNIRADFELVNYCEIDKYASSSYSQIHHVSEDLNLHDVTAVDPSKIGPVDLITYGFPCQDISVVGHQRGFECDGVRTRSGLFYEALRIIEGCRPVYAIAENVKALTSNKFKSEFAAVLGGLSAAGYNNYYKVLNAKDYGIPQNRERVFIVSIRKDCDAGCFSFPDKIPLMLRLKDFLEAEVPDKFYLSTEKADQLLASLNASYVSPAPTDKIIKAGMTPGYRRVNTVIDPQGVSPTLAARDYKDPLRVLVSGSCIDDTQNFDDSPRVYEDTVPTLRAGRSGLMVLEDPTERQIGNIVSTGNFKNPQRGRIYDPLGIAPTLNTMTGGGLTPKILEPVCAASRGRNPNNPGDRTPGIDTVQRLEINGDGVCNTLTTVQKDNYVLEPAISKVGNLDGHETGAVLSPDGLCKTLKATDYKNPVKTLVPADPLIVGSLQKNAAVKSDGVTPCLTASMGSGGGQTPVIVPFAAPFLIRKLTPRECWRLMGFFDSDFDSVKNISNAQLYKQAGNSICVPVLERIFIKLLEHEQFRKILGIGD